MKSRSCAGLLALALCLSLLAVCPTKASAEGTNWAAPTFSNESAVLADGTLVGWGSTFHRFESIDTYTIETLGTGYIATGQGWAVKADHSLWMWGDSRLIRGIDDKNLPHLKVPEKVMDNVQYARVIQIDQAGAVVVLRTDGSVWGWGSRTALYGDEGRIPASSPVKLLDGVKQLSGNMMCWMAVKEDGSLWGAGADFEGLIQLGFNEDSAILCPLQKIMDGVRSISVGADTALAIKTDGSLWVWGTNQHGERGNGTALTYDRGFLPAQILENVVYACAGETCFAITADGTLYGWGLNSYGQIGSPASDATCSMGACQTKPVATASGAIAANSQYVDSTGYMLKPDGSLWYAGYNPLSGGSQSSWTKFLDGVKVPDGTATSNPGINTGTAFADVPASHWAAKDIAKAAELGLVTGTGDGLFNPNREMSHAEFIAMVTRAFWGDEVKAQGTSGEWYTPNLNVANAHGLLNGTRLASGTGVPETKLNRYEMAVIIANVRAQKGGAPNQAAVENAKRSISDWSQIPPAYQQAVAASFASGLITGTDISGTFNGDGTMTRAQAATVLVRMVG